MATFWRWVFDPNRPSPEEQLREAKLERNRNALRLRSHIMLERLGGVSEQDLELTVPGNSQSLLCTPVFEKLVERIEASEIKIADLLERVEALESKVGEWS